MEGAPPAQQPRHDKQGTPWTLIAIAVLAVYALLIVILNREEVEISFVFFSTRISKLVLVLLCLGLGFVLGYLFDGWRKRGRE
jgi:uncharacterized integral membrane protein